MSEYVQSDPPPPARRGSVANQKFAKFLRTNPGVWYEHPHTFSSPHSAHGSAWNINAGKTVAFGDEYEARSRAQPDGSGKVWVRYVGDTNE